MHIRHNQKGLFFIITLLTSGLLFLGCGTYIWVTVKEKPGIPALEGANTLGIGQFHIIIQNNPHALVKINESPEEWSIVGGLGGTTNEAHVVIKAPDAASYYAVTEEVLTQLIQQDLTGFLSGKKNFKVSAVTGMSLEKIADEDELGTKSEALPAVVKIPEIIDPLMEKKKIASLGAQYRVDFILGGEIKVTAEILKATDKLNEGSITSGDAPLRTAGEYGLFLDISFDYGLYDATSGTLLTNSRKTNTKYVNPSLIENNIIGLTSVPAGNYGSLLEYLNSPSYIQLYRERLTKILLNYIYLFRPYYRSFQQKVEKDSNR